MSESRRSSSIVNDVCILIIKLSIFNLTKNIKVLIKLQDFDSLTEQNKFPVVTSKCCYIFKYFDS